MGAAPQPRWHRGAFTTPSARDAVGAIADARGLSLRGAYFRRWLIDPVEQRSARSACPNPYLELIHHRLSHHAPIFRPWTDVPFQWSRAASPATTKRVSGSRRVCSRGSREAACPDVLAFCEGAGLSWRELLTVYAVGSVRSAILASYKEVCQRGKSQRAPSAIADPVRPVARFVSIASKRTGSTSAYSSHTARAPRTQPSSERSTASSSRVLRQNASGLTCHHPADEIPSIGA